MIGRRLPDRTWPDAWPAPGEKQDGDFWYVHDGPWDDRVRGRKGHWCCVAPGGHSGNLANHLVEEHEDGLISVLPPPPNGEPNSILIQTRRDGQDIELWHGFIHHGEWRHC